MTLSNYVKQKRSQADLTQPELAEKAGVGLRFVRDLEQGKETLRMDKVNQILKLFGAELGPVVMNRNLHMLAEPGIIKIKGAEIGMTHIKAGDEKS